MLLRLQIIGVQILVDVFGRYADPGLGHQNIAGRHGWQWSQLLSDALSQCCAAHDTIRHIGADFHAPLHELLLGKSQPVHAVQPVQNGRRVGASSCHARCHRNVFFQVNGKSAPDVKFLKQQIRSLIYQIIFIGGQIIEIRSDPDSFFVLLHQRKTIKNTHCLHDHPYVVVAVLPSSEHVQTQINLCQCL